MTTRRGAVTAAGTAAVAVALAARHLRVANRPISAIPVGDGSLRVEVGVEAWAAVVRFTKIGQTRMFRIGSRPVAGILDSGAALTSGEPKGTYDRHRWE